MTGNEGADINFLSKQWDDEHVYVCILCIVLYGVPWKFHCK